MNYVFIDESGTNKNDGFAVISGVPIPKTHIEYLETLIIKIESSLKISMFHWSKHKWSIRHNFLSQIIRSSLLCDIEVIVTVKRYPLELSHFYKEAIKIIVGQKILSRLVIDGEKSHAYERRIKQILRENAVSTRILYVQRDTATPILRFADCVAGLTRYRFVNPSDIKSEELFSFMKNNIRVHTHLL